MNIQQIVSKYPGIVSLLFTMYGIDRPVNYDTLSAAIAINSTDNGNPFLSDLMATIEGNNYDDYDDYDEILGLGKKGKAKRDDRRAAHGGKTRAGRIFQGVGKIFKKKDAGEAAVNKAAETPLAAEANQAQSDDAPKNKITLENVVNGVGAAAGAASQIIDSLKGGGGGAVDNGGGGEDGGGDGDGGKKWYQKPLILVGIGAGILAIVGIIIAVVKSKNPTK